MADEAVYDRVLGLLTQVAQLEDQLMAMRRHHLQTMLTLVCMAGGEIRISEFDYLAVKLGTSLATFVDPKTGDRVFVAKQPTATTEPGDGVSN